MGEIAVVGERDGRWLGVRPRAAAADPTPEPAPMVVAPAEGPISGSGHVGEAGWQQATWMERADLGG